MILFQQIFAGKVAQNIILGMLGQRARSVLFENFISDLIRFHHATAKTCSLSNQGEQPPCPRPAQLPPSAPTPALGVPGARVIAALNTPGSIQFLSKQGGMGFVFIYPFIYLVQNVDAQIEKRIITLPKSIECDCTMSGCCSWLNSMLCDICQEPGPGGECGERSGQLTHYHD